MSAPHRKRLNLGLPKQLVLVLLLPFLQATPAPAGLGLFGQSGALLTPTATVVPDAALAIGVGYLPARYAVLRAPRFGDKVYSITIGYLPFLETTWGILRSDHIGNRWGIGDRFAFFRFRLHRETRKWPALVLGLHDPFGIVGESWAQHLCAAYLAATKTRSVAHREVALTLGYGTSAIPAAQHQLVGPFGSLVLKYSPHLALLAEYDTSRLNAGLRLRARRVELVAGLLGFRTLTGRLNLHFSLLPVRKKLTFRGRLSPRRAYRLNLWSSVTLPNISWYVAAPRR